MRWMGTPHWGVWAYHPDMDGESENVTATLMGVTKGDIGGAKWVHPLPSSKSGELQVIRAARSHAPET